MFQEFKEFIMRGNVVDLAVGVIIGAAFTSIVNSLVDDIIMPPIGLLLGGVDFSNLALTIKEATAEAEAVTINYGLFLNAVIQFLIVAFVIFLVVKAINSMKREEEEAPAEPTTEEKLLDAINDLTVAIRNQ